MGICIRSGSVRRRNKVRMTFFNQGPNQVRQLGHISTDGGKTWTVTFDLTYVRKNKTPTVASTD